MKTPLTVSLDELEKIAFSAALSARDRDDVKLDSLKNGNAKKIPRVAVASEVARKPTKNSRLKVASTKKQFA